MFDRNKNEDRLIEEILSLKKRIKELEAQKVEHVRVEHQLRAFEQRWRSLVELAPDGILTLNMKGVVTSVNTSFLELSGFARDEIVGKYALRLGTLRARDLPRYAGILARILKGGVHPPIEFLYRKKDKTTAWAEARVVVVKKGGVGREIIGIARDISDRKQAEVAREQSEAKYRQLFSAISAVVLVIDRELGRIVDVNDAAMSLYGYNREEWLAMAPSDVDTDPEKMRRAVAELPADADVHYHRHKDGDVFPIEMSFSTFTHADRYLIIAVGQDVTELRQLEEQLQQSQKMEAVGRLAGGVAHDFNNILTGIIGSAEAIQAALGGDHSLTMELEEIIGAGKRAAGLTRQLLAFSRRQIIAPEVIDVNTLLARFRKMLDRVIGEDIKFILRLGDDLWNIKADPSQIDQILANLAINARDAMPDGGTLTIETANRTVEGSERRVPSGISPGDFVIITVSDTGHGMDDETKSLIFEPFFSTKGKERGTGLGLSTVYGIVQQNHGFIQVATKAGSGTTFNVYLPRSEDDDDARDDSRAANRLTGDETILLAEDEELVRRITRNILKARGYDVLEAVDGADALNRFHEHKGEIHLLLSDVIMPNLNGIELYEKLTMSRPTLKVLYMSGYAEDVIGQHGILSGKTPFIAKPFTTESLSKKVRDVLDS